LLSGAGGEVTFCGVHRRFGNLGRLGGIGAQPLNRGTAHLQAVRRRHALLGLRGTVGLEALSLDARGLDNWVWGWEHKRQTLLWINLSLDEEDSAPNCHRRGLMVSEKQGEGVQTLVNLNRITQP
jgi:hypothetical protein